MCRAAAELTDKDQGALIARLRIDLVPFTKSA
jgi:hypothetical protein